MSRSAPRRAGFTLIEMMATVVIMGIVLAFAVSFYQQLVGQTETALARSREARQALAVLGRLGSDLEAAYLLKKPEDVDPLFHPWLFRATSSGGELGGDRVLFVTRNHRARTIDSHESDLAVVAYWLREGAEGGYELMRWSSTNLQDTLAFEVLDVEEEAVVLADGVADFGLRFLSELGEWSDEWDSSLMLESSELPAGVEISVALMRRDEQGFVDEPLDEFGDPLGAVEERRHVYRRRVPIPVRPIDLAALLETDEQAGAEDGDDEDEEGCWTVAGCVAEFGQQVLGSGQATQGDLDNLVASEGDVCVNESSIAQLVQAAGVCQ